MHVDVVSHGVGAAGGDVVDAFDNVDGIGHQGKGEVFVDGYYGSVDLQTVSASVQPFATTSTTI